MQKPPQHISPAQKHPTMPLPTKPACNGRLSPNCDLCGDQGTQEACELVKTEKSVSGGPRRVEPGENVCCWGSTNL